MNLGHNPDAHVGELNRQREGFDTKAHLESAKDAPKWQDLSPEEQAEFIVNLRQQPAPTTASPVAREARPEAPIKLTVEDLRSLAGTLGYMLVAIGDKPPVDDGYAINREARIKELEADNEKLYNRAIAAEATAADAIRELNKLKSAAPKESS